MTSRPWMKFYPSDWQSDERLGMCSLAARGIWMEMLALMHKADPYGHLLVNGMKPSDEQLAALARASCDQTRTCVQELEQHGVFSRTRNGTIYSRRMTKDEKKRKDGVKAATEGELEGSRRNKQHAKNKWKKEPPPRVVDRVEEQPPLIPEARGQRYSEPNGSAPPRSAHQALTDTVWRECPAKLVALGMPEPRARSQIGKWLKDHKPEEVLRAVEQAERVGTKDPVPYITALLKPKADRPWRRTDDGGYAVRPGTADFERLKAHANRHDRRRYYDFVAAEKSGDEVVVAEIYPK